MNLNQITLTVRDVERSTAFYLRLGLHLIVDAAPRYVRFECPAETNGANGEAAGPPSTLSLHRGEALAEAPPEAAPRLYDTLYFEVPDVDASVRRLEAAGVEILAAPQDQRWRWREAYIEDPDGRRLCIYHAGDDRRHPPWRLDPPRTEADSR